MQKEQMESRFWAKVNRNGPTPPHCPELGSCWIWEGATTRGGYGNFKIPRTRKNIRSNRCVFFLVHGELPKNHALHHCDNPPCCNPAHIYDGTRSDNTRDMYFRRRTKWQKLGLPCPVTLTPKPRGVENHNAKLTEEKARDIKVRRMAGEKQSCLAREYGVTYQTIQSIESGRARGWVSI